MSGIGSWLWGASSIDDAIEKATSELMPTGTEDMALNLEICDQIRSKSFPPKDAMRALKKRLNHKNPNVQLLALGLTDICIKNGGDHFLAEVASREFMDNLSSMLKMQTLNRDVKDKLLRYIQTWAIATDGKPSLSYVSQTYRSLKGEGYVFPPEDRTIANKAMVDTQTAPEWIDSDVCLRCRTAFSLMNRKHHCRNCGLVFDQACSSKSLPLPHFGITQEVRVCDSCHTKLTRHKDQGLHTDGKRHRSSQSVSTTRHRAARDYADAELQRAIQLSLQEVNGPQHGRSGYVPYQDSLAYQASEPPLVERSTRPSSAAAAEEDDPDLRAAIEASLREANAPKPSAPIGVETPRSEQSMFPYSGAGYSQSYPPSIAPQPDVPSLPNHDLEPLESDTIMTFSQTIDQVQAQGGRDISRYPAVGQLYDKANGLRPKLALSLDDTGRKEDMLKEMNDKLSQAVKLYDQLLTQQLSRPTWRQQQSPQAAPPPALNQYRQSMWNGVPPQTPMSPQMQQPATGYAPSYQAPPSAVPSEPPYAQSQQQPPAQTSWQQYSEPQAQQSQYAPPPAQSTYVPMSPPPTQQPSFVPMVSQPYSQYQPPSHQQPQYAPSAPPGPPQASPQQPANVPQFAQLPQSPPQHATSLSRHNTLPAQPQAHPYAAVPSPPVPQSQHLPNSSLGRQNTVASYAPQREPQHQAPALPQAQYAPPPPQVQQPALPNFPAVPTAPPQPYHMYGSGVEREEKKEALLIDL